MESLWENNPGEEEFKDRSKYCESRYKNCHLLSFTNNWYLMQTQRYPIYCFKIVIFFVEIYCYKSWYNIYFLTRKDLLLIMVGKISFLLEWLPGCGLSGDLDCLWGWLGPGVPLPLVGCPGDRPLLLSLLQVPIAVKAAVGSVTLPVTLTAMTHNTPEHSI